MSRARLEDELLAYAKGERFRYFSLPVAGDDSTTAARATPLTDAGAAALKADLRWHTKIVHSSNEISEFATEFKSLLGREPGITVALRDLALALIEQKDYQGAFRYLRQASEADATDASNHRAFGVLLGAMEAAGSPDPTGNSSYNEALMCARLSPNYADAYRLMAFSLMRQGDYDEAETMMQKALSLSPRSEVYKLNLADIELKKKDYAPALALLQELKNSDSPDIAKQAEYFIAANIEKKEEAKLPH
jgi:Flp pilus assembly protein TadD